MVAYVLLLGLMWNYGWNGGTFGEKNSHTFESCELFLLREAFGLFIHLCIMWGIWREKKLLFASPLYC